MAAPVSADQVRHALRRMRPSTYEINADASGTSVALVMAASEAGRRNAAQRLVSLLAEQGLRPDADDAVEVLTGSPRPLAVLAIDG